MYKKPAWDVEEKLPRFKKEKERKKASMGCVSETPERKIKEAWVCRRNSPDKDKASTGCVRETPQIKKKKRKPAPDV